MEQKQENNRDGILASCHNFSSKINIFPFFQLFQDDEVFRRKNEEGRMQSSDGSRLKPKSVFLVRIFEKSAKITKINWLNLHFNVFLFEAPNQQKNPYQLSDPSLGCT